MNVSARHGVLGLVLIAVLALGLYRFVSHEALPDGTNPGSGAELILYCGAGLRPAAEALIEVFSATQPITIRPTYAGSGRLLGQLAASQVGDLFMPGSSVYVDKAIEQELALAASRRDVAYFVPVIVVQPGNPLQVTSLADLAQQKLRLGLGDERAVAVGRQAHRLFEKNGIALEAVQANVVYRSGTVNELGVALEMKTLDAAIMWDANARQFADTTDTVPIPDEQNLVATIPLVVLSMSRFPEQAQSFVDFVATAAGREVLTEQRYTVTLQSEKRGHSDVE